ncbi:MAG: CHAT domain-containing protein [Planctomycetaceae bacterium]|nr:CHAT domain-containing protein [Planctomycetales bacterium]MCB9926331.1 CHAT domain-containing protein [Planctomycetaceae bacterium]
MKTFGIATALLLTCGAGTGVSFAELLDVKRGTRIVVRVDDAPITLREGYVGYAPRDSEFDVLGTQGTSLRIHFQGWDGSIHRNFVSLKGAVDTIGDHGVSIASLMSSPVIDAANPFLIPRLGELAASLVASGRERELLNIERELLDAAGRNRGPFGAFYQAQCYGVLGGMHLSSGDTPTGLGYTNQAFGLAQHALWQLENGTLREPNRGDFMKLATIHLMAANGWSQANAGYLADGERKLSIACEAMDRALPVSELLERAEFARPVDSRIYTWHADALLRSNLVAEAQNQLIKAEKCGEAYLRWLTHPLMFGRPTSSGYGGYPEALMALCLVHEDDLDGALDKMNLAQRRQHRYAMWPGHVDDPTLELFVREKRGSSAIDNFTQDPFDFAMSLAKFMEPSSNAATLTAEWIINRKFRMQDNLTRQASVVNDNQGEGGRSKMPDSAWMSLGSSFGTFATDQRLRGIRGLAADFALRAFSEEEFDVARREFETVRYVGAALRSTRLEELAVVPEDVRRAHWLSVSPSYNPKTKKVDSGDSKALVNWHDSEAQRTWTTVNAIQRHLEDDQALVEFARYREFDFGRLGSKYGWRPPRYVACVVPAKGQAKIIDLGEAELIERAITAWRASLQESSGENGAINSFGEPEATVATQRIAQGFAKIVIDPVRDAIRSSKNLVICPDAALWLVPWAAIPWEEDAFLIERFPLRIVTTGRELTEPVIAAGQAVSNSKSDPLIVVDPNYSMSISELLAQENRIENREPSKPSIMIAKRGKSLIRQVSRLPYTKVEGELVAPSVAKYTGEVPLVYFGDSAIEAVFETIKSPPVLVISSHAFFLPPRTEEESGGRLDIRDPLMRCGLLLAACNHHDNWNMRRANDGVLTGYEVSGFDLRGTDLVVLSACDTGIGDVRHAEGILGLRQAFHLAGANAVVASLWQVPDRETALLMTKFFEELAAGSNKHEALRNAQLERIAARRAKHGSAHPYLWAAFSVTGN